MHEGITPHMDLKVCVRGQGVPITKKKHKQNPLLNTKNIIKL